MTDWREYEQIIIDDFCQALQADPNPKIRAKVAEILGKIAIGNEKAFLALRQAFLKDKNRQVRISAAEAITQIIPQSNLKSIMSEPSKYNISNPQNVQIVETTAGGDAVIHKYAQQQNLTEAAQQIQDLIEYIQKTNPTTTEEEAVKQIIKQNPTLKTRLVNALKQGGTEALKVFFPLVSIPLETIRGFIEAD
ncbi:HEAT repeat domain-containing protein [Gloeothece verrucosa]|nr:HEAT repeat domain-containing protein [Gloeothece verrucosa]